MSTENKNENVETTEEEVINETIEAEEIEVEVLDEEPAEEENVNPVEAMVKEILAQQEEKYIRLAAEYDNFRKRTAKEKETLYQDGKSSVATAFLPVYDNLERALKHETTDEAYKKGVEMTMTQLKEILTKLGITEIPALGETFNPELHNAVMHIDDENFGENTVAEVFQTGFLMGEKVVRFAMVKVAN